jgi:hypothetical protein
MIFFFFLNKQIFFPFQHNEDTHAGVSQMSLTRKRVGSRQTETFEVSTLLSIQQVYNIAWMTV